MNTPFTNSTVLQRVERGGKGREDNFMPFTTQQGTGFWLTPA